jgi:hypothetical protein
MAFGLSQAPLQVVRSTLLLIRPSLFLFGLTPCLGRFSTGTLHLLQQFRRQRQ